MNRDIIVNLVENSSMVGGNAPTARPKPAAVGGQTGNAIAVRMFSGEA